VKKTSARFRDIDDVHVRVYSLNSWNVFQPAGDAGHPGELCLHGDQPGNASLGVSSTVSKF